MHVNRKDTIENIHEISNLQELINAIDKLISVSGNKHPSEIYIEDGRGDNLSLFLIQSILSDGSTTYEVRIS